MEYKVFLGLNINESPVAPVLLGVCQKRQNLAFLDSNSVFQLRADERSSTSCTHGKEGSYRSGKMNMSLNRHFS